MYSQFNDPTYSSQKSSFGIPCSDEKLKLYDLIQIKASQQNKKPLDISSKIKQAKKDFFNTDNTNDTYFSFTKLKAVDNSTNNNFKQKFYELAKLSGNEIQRKKEKQYNIYSIYQPSNSRNKKESKNELLKKQILMEITRDNRDSTDKLRGFSMGKLSNSKSMFNF